VRGRQKIREREREREREIGEQSRIRSDRYVVVEETLLDLDKE
jgi:hypothetical protein